MAQQSANTERGRGTRVVGKMRSMAMLLLWKTVMYSSVLEYDHS